ncbi:G5 domain-containing protein [uncultured Acidaminococcus sp.]|uniref:G5 domain-containing protein n=1 Tax=uncultured Acidaminococcus sp. TaxID=352152 RepID=UPI00266FA1DE|nr:G5 domain-containing protein [uncultured Acidaminococcus sp.]
MRKSQPFKRPYKWIVVCLLLAASVNLVGFAAQPKIVSIKVDGQTITLQTRALTVQGALEEAGVVLQKADGYELVGEEEKLNDGATIEVTRAMPVKVWKAGRTTEYTIGRKTVRDVLNAVGVDYKGFQVYPGLDTEVTPDMTIHIISPTNKLTTETRDIPYEVEMRNNDNLPRGRQNVISPGQNGQEKVTYREIKVGSETVRQELNREVLSEPVPEIVEVGTGNNLNMIETSRGFVRYRSARTVEASAYTMAEGSGTGLTSTGVVPYHGVVAVDPDVIPYGTRMYIPGYGFAVAADCGGAINGNTIDLFMEDYGDAISWGRRDVTVYFLE